MAVEPYAPCPCGSGQKFKWCCHKVESYADRARKLHEGGQIDRALGVLDEGLRKEPGNAWLLTRRAIYQIRADRPEEARATTTELLRRHPQHLGAWSLMTRLVLDTEGGAAGAAVLQQALTSASPTANPTLAVLAGIVGAYLSDGDVPAARKHLSLALSLAGETVGPNTESTLRVIEGNPSISPWLRNGDELSTVPEAADTATKGRFQEALDWANQGLWSSAAAAFATLGDDPVAGPAAERNAGFCRLWLADSAGAADHFRRYLRRAGPTVDAVDVEALRQVIEPTRPDDLLEIVQLSWPVRDRQALLETLRGDPSVDDEGPVSLDPDDEKAPELDSFALLDRPNPDHGKTTAPVDGGASLRPADLPRIVGRVFVDQEKAILEATDDGRLDGLSDRFTGLAASSLAPAHPRTKVLDRIARSAAALTWEWLLPEEIETEHRLRLVREQGAEVIRTIWPATPMSFLGGRTPLQAAEDGDSEVPLRAALLILERAREPWNLDFDFASLRERLRIQPEPPIDPATLDVERLHLSRLPLVPFDQTSDEVLADVYRRARRALLPDALEPAARALASRPGAIERLGLSPRVVFTDLTFAAHARDDLPAAVEWARRGRQADPDARNPGHAAHWDLTELRLQTRKTRPEDWVPELIAVLERYRNQPGAGQSIVSNLIDMGFLQLVPHPDQPGEMLLDSRVLEALIAEYGPRITTATGRLGVSATRPDIWTPGSEGAGPGGIWTPGSPAGGGESGGKKLILPG